MIYKYLGAIHIHTNQSDGTGDINAVSKAAKSAGLDWIIITDHNNFDIEEGIFNGVYVIKGEELSPADKHNHYLALGIDKKIEPSNTPRENIENVRQNGGFGFSAHPDEKDSRKNPYKPIKWTDKNAAPDGVEIWNWFSMWGDNFDASNIFTVAYSFFFRKKLVKKPYRQTLQWWDELNNGRNEIVPAIGGVDAHAMKIKKYIIPVTVFSYKYMFNTIVNEIYTHNSLSKDFAAAKKQILSAVKNGNNIIYNRLVCKKPPLEIYVENEKEVKYCGETLSFNKNLYINVNLPVRAIVNVIRNGVTYKTYRGKSLRLEIKQEGIYRIEAEINGYGYFYTNPLRVV